MKMGLRILRLKCKEMPKKKTLTSICRWLDCPKNLLNEQKLQKPLEIPICK